MEINIDELPAKYLDNREIIEARVVMTMWKSPELFLEYEIKDDELLYDDSKLLYKIGKQMINSGIAEFDIVTTETYLNDYPKLKDMVEEVGGVREIVNTVKTMNVNNFENYYDKLIQSNYMIKLFLTQKQIANEFDKIKSMDDSQTMADYVEYLISEINDTQISKKAEHNDFYLSDKLFDEIINGEFINTISFGEYAKILDSVFNGLPEECVTLFSGLSGASKSTFTMSNVVYPVIKQGYKVLVISNELSYRQYMLIFITIILARELNYFKITRDKLNKNKLTTEDIEMLRQAQKIINEKYDKPIHFINMNTSSSQEVIRAIRKYSKLGYYLTVYDTAKPDSSISDNNGQSWQKSLEMIKELTYVTQETKTHLWLPFQIANNADNKYRLSRMDLAECKNIITMITNHGILRKLKPEEKDKDNKYYCNPYKLVYNESLGKWIKEKIQLEQDKKYVCVFIDKTRFGEDGQWILYEFLGAWGIYREIGLCVPAMNNERR